MKFLVLAAALALVPVTAASAQSMNAEVFYKRAVALQKKGPMAVFSMGEVKALMREGAAAGKATAAAQRAAKAAGKPARYCPPEGKQSMGSDEYMKRLSAIPQAERAKIDMTEATTRIMATKYPCPRTR